MLTPNKTKKQVCVNVRLDQRTSQAQLSHQTDSFNCCITAAHIKGIGCARIERQKRLVGRWLLCWWLDSTDPLPDRSSFSFI
jgi:hypothetical protein